MSLQALVRRDRAVPATAIAFFCALALAACEDNQAPGPAPQSLSIVSGDGQYSKKGTELESPVVVKVTLSDGKAGAGETVRFTVVEGGGSLSRGTVAANSRGEASVRWTLGPATGEQRIRAAVEELSAQIVATSSEYYCPEEDPAFTPKFTPAGDLFLLTKASSLNPDRVGLVQIDPAVTTFSAESFVSWDEGILTNIVRDCVFSASGDFYVAWTTGAAVQEIIKINPDRSHSHFATLESFFGTEIDILPGGVLAGCDEFGPFTVGCRDTLTRYEDAMFSGVGRDAANHNAMAADPSGGGLYFIDRATRSLRHLPLDGYAQTGPHAKVGETLSFAEADSAAGMAVDGSDGSIYLLVDSPGTKGIVRVTSAGVKTTAVDFFAERGAGDLAGIQSDLAIDRNTRVLYTLDTLNNVILVYNIATGGLGTLASAGGPGDASNSSSTERVGLAVMP